MSTLRRVERGFAIIGLAATAAAGLGFYAAYAYRQEYGKLYADLGRPSGFVGRKLPDAFILHLDLDQTSITDTAPSTYWESFLGLGPHTMSLRSVVKSIESAADDDRVQGFLTTGCGGVHGLAAVQELRKAVTQFNQANKRFTSVFHTESFGEAENKTLAYYLASAFKKVFMQPTGRLITTGFSLQTPFFKDLLDKWKVQFRVWAREEFKTAFNMFTESDYTQPHREQMEFLLESVFNQVASDIAESRGMTTEEVEHVIYSAPLTAQQAQEAGFVDRLLYGDDIWTYLCDNQPLPKISVRDYSRMREHEQRRQRRKKKPEVVVMNLTGTIFSGWQPPTSQSSSICSGKVQYQLNQLAKNKDVKAVVLRVDSSGGSAVASDAIRRQIEKVKAAGKYVVVSMGNTAASGGYFISLAADSIVASPGSLTGSIGVIVGMPFLKEVLNDHGVKVEVIKKGNNADMLSPFTEVTPEQQDILHRLLNQIYDDFLEKVHEARGKPLPEVENMARGRLWLGSDAYDYGLVDEMGGLSEAIELAKSGASLPSDACVMEYPASNRIIELLGSFLHQFQLGLPVPVSQARTSFELYSLEAEFVLGSLSS